MANFSTAVATGLRVVRATFSSALSDFSTTAATGACNPANWTLTGQVTQPVPVAAVTVLSVAQISTTILDVTVSDDLSPSRSYLIIAKAAALGGITGVASSPNDRTTLVAVALTPPAERDFSTLAMVPRMNIREDDTKDLERFLRIIGEPLDLLLHRVDHWADILDYDLAPDNFLDLMLRDLHYPFNIALSTVDKRRLLSVLMTMYRQKGTIVGVKNVIRFFLGYECDVVFPDNAVVYDGWVLDEGELDYDTYLGSGHYYNSTLHGPDTGGIATAWDFYLKIGKPAAAALTADETLKANAIIDYMKPLNTHKKGLSSVLPPPATAAAAAGVGQVTITWSAVASAVGYAVFWSSTPFVTALSTTGAVDPDNASPYVITPVTAGQPRYAIVCARDGSGINGVSSVVVNATAT